MLASKKKLKDLTKHEQIHSLTYGSRFTDEPIPKFEIPENSTSPDLAYQVIHDELALDGNASLNLASFVTTWMDKQAQRLMGETLNKNYIDQAEYPQTTELHHRCVNMLARLYHSPEHETALGTATIGSSEAIHLAGLALKWNWRKRRQAQNKPTGKPNIVMGNNVQVCWEKFTRYFEVQARTIPLSNDRYIIDVSQAIEQVDENTIGVVGILGSTYTGEYEPIETLNQQISALNAKTGWEVPIHVDAASGGFVAPFATPKLKWDFRLEWVKSINVSGHKYGLVYPGIGWIIWRDSKALPQELIFNINYLGEEQPTFNLNFSKGAAQILGQYYNFIRLGKTGYQQIILSLLKTSEWISERLRELDQFKLLSKPYQLPVVTFALQEQPGYNVFDISEKLRERGWIVPAYTLAPHADHISALRIVVKEGFSRDMAELFIADIKKALHTLESKTRKYPQVEESKQPSKKQGIC